MQYQIPQDIEVADKIIGPLTLKQFMYLISGVGFGVGIYAALRNTVIPTVIIFILALFPVGLFAMIGFMKINGRPVDSYIAPFFSFMGAAKKRFWQRETVQVNQEEELQRLRDETEKNKEIMPQKTRSEVAENIANLATIVDTTLQPTMAKEPSTVFEVNEERGSKLNNLLKEKAATTQGGREPLVSQLASVSPTERPDTIDQEINDTRLEERIQTKEDYGQKNN